MKIRYMSDLHLEFSNFKPEPAEADVVVLAGDIHLNTRGLDWAAKAFPDVPVIYVPGNHEFYNSEYIGLEEQLRIRAARLGIHLLSNDEVVLGGVRFLGATLWTDYALYGIVNQEAAKKEAENCMEDHWAIRIAGGKRFRPQDAEASHKRSVDFLSSRLSQPFAGPTAVVTHHAPSWLSVPPQFHEDPLSPAFASNLDELVIQANLWIHGHTHKAVNYRIGSCSVVNNPRGYVRPNVSEDTGFSDPLIYDLAV